MWDHENLGVTEVTQRFWCLKPQIEKVVCGRWCVGWSGGIASKAYRDAPRLHSSAIRWWQTSNEARDAAAFATDSHARVFAAARMQGQSVKHYKSDVRMDDREWKVSAQLPTDWQTASDLIDKLMLRTMRHFAWADRYWAWIIRPLQAMRIAWNDWY